MKKSIRKTLLGMTIAMAFVASASAVFVARTNDQTSNIVQAFENVDDIAQTALGNYSSKTN